MENRVGWEAPACGGPGLQSARSVGARRWLALFLCAGLAACGGSQVPGVADAGHPGDQPESTDPNPPTGGFLQGPGTFVVNSTEDATDLVPGDGRCATAAGKCSLRAAVQESNSALLLSTNPL